MLPTKIIKILKGKGITNPRRISPSLKLADNAKIGAISAISINSIFMCVSILNY